MGLGSKASKFSGLVDYGGIVFRGLGLSAFMKYHHKMT